MGLDIDWVFGQWVWMHWRVSRWMSGARLDTTLSNAARQHRYSSHTVSDIRGYLPSYDQASKQPRRAKYLSSYQSMMQLAIWKSELLDAGN